tara:strand:- start:264 stop:884 length:621 start_codon:yes stop_codon:yes gene_type:complete
MKSEFIKVLKKKLMSKLPGPTEHQSMLAKPLNKEYRFPKVSNQYTQASVLILIFPHKNIWNFFLTKRTDRLKYHKGQISLPGGTKNKGETLEETALRETEEEIGVNKLEISLIGKLTPYKIPVTPFKIFPFIGWTKAKPYTHPNTQEVQKIITVSIDSLINKKNKKNKIISMKDINVSIPYFELESEHVWGATGCILNEFRELLTA